MLSFSAFITERMTDPEVLATRASRIFGKKTSFGKWEKVEKGGHIPLSTFSSRNANAAAGALYKKQKQLNFDHKDPELRAKGRAEFERLHTKKHMKIADLHATQPFVRTNDPDKLKAKLSTTNPDHIHVVTHKGTHYISDGHHAVYAAHLRGEKTVPVSHINLDS